MDARLRDLERAAVQGLPGAGERWVAELERAGVLQALQAEVDARLAAVQDEGDDLRLDAPDVAGCVRAAMRPEACGRALVLRHRSLEVDLSGHRPYGITDDDWRRAQRTRGDSLRTVAVVVLEGDFIVFGIDRAQTSTVEEFASALDRGPRAEFEVLAVLSSKARDHLIRSRTPIASAWSRWYPNRARSDLIEHMRTRPAMYVGGVGEWGACALADELFMRAGEQALGRCRAVHVQRGADGALAVTDDGRGLPEGADERTGVPSIEAEFVEYRRNDSTHPYRNSLLIGPAVVNALSAWLEVESHHEGTILQQRFEHGVALGPPRRLGRTDRTGLSIRFLPDPTIFLPPATISFAWLSRRLRELAFLHPGLTCTLEQPGAERAPEVHHSPGGVLDGLVDQTAGHETILSRPIVAEGQDASPTGSPVRASLALTWTRRPGERLESWVNDYLVREGGHHLRALRAALTGSFVPSLTAEQRLTKPSFAEGLEGLVVLQVPDAQYLGSTRTRLANPEVEPLVRRLVTSALRTFVRERPAEAQAVVDQALARGRSRRRRR